MAKPPTIFNKGEKFGRLTVLQRTPRGTKSYYLCQCDCGKLHTAYCSDLKNGNTQSCGCLKVEQLAINRSKIDRSKNIKHSMYRTPTWNSWFSMLNRCRHPEGTYLDGKGTKVCMRFQLFLEFLADLDIKPPGTSIHRIDNNGHYSCGKCEECISNGWSMNVKWATRSEQNTNQRKVKKGEMRMLKNFTDTQLRAEMIRRGLL